MLIKVLALIGTLLSFAIAQPLNGTLVERQATAGNRCGDSLFVDKTSAGSPRLFDCAAIIYDIRVNYLNQDIYVDLPEANGPIHRLFTQGSCTFGVRRAYQGSGTAPAVIGTGDIDDVINDSIKKFGRNDQVGAEGAMVCISGAGVWWGLFRT